MCHKTNGTYLVSGYITRLAPESLRFVAEMRQTYEEFAAASLSDIRNVPFLSGHKERPLFVLRGYIFYRKDVFSKVKIDFYAKMRYYSSLPLIG